MAKFGGWEQSFPALGKGGQGTVYLATRPERVQQRNDLAQEAIRANPWELRLNSQERPERVKKLAPALYEYARPDNASEVGALKVFEISDDDPHEAQQAVARLRNEIAVLRHYRPGLIRLLDANEAERWMVTEYMPYGTLAQHPLKFRGNPLGALKAFRSLVKTVADLHDHKTIHRDIKPGNIFLTADGDLVLGDLGLVFLPDQPVRPTTTTERVGPRDYMPPWCDLGIRVDDVRENADVYMLGKLLWCMVSGRLKLPREYHNRESHDLTVMFKDDPNMNVINDIVGRCVVEEERDCLQSGHKLLEIVDEILPILQHGAPMLNRKGELAFPCRICGKGFYQEHATVQVHINDSTSRGQSPIPMRIFTCNVCTHYEFFAPAFPNQAAQKAWEPWRSLKDKTP